MFELPLWKELVLIEGKLKAIVA